MKFKNKKTGTIVNTTTETIANLYKANKEYEEVKEGIKPVVETKKEK